VLENITLMDIMTPIMDSITPLIGTLNLTRDSPIKSDSEVSMENICATTDTPGIVQCTTMLLPKKLHGIWSNMVVVSFSGPTVDII